MKGLNHAYIKIKLPGEVVEAGVTYIDHGRGKLEIATVDCEVDVANDKVMSNLKRQCGMPHNKR